MGARPWSWSSTTYTAPTRFSSSSFRPSIFFSFHSKRRRVTTFSLPNIQPSSPPPPRPPSSQNSDLQRRKSIKVDTPISKPVIIKENVKNEVASATKTQIESLSLKSLSEEAFLSQIQKLFSVSKKVRGILLLNLVTIVYASNIPVVKEVEAVMDPAAFTVMRFGMTAIPFLPFIFRARNDDNTRNAGIELGLWVSLGYLMQALGLLTSGAGRAAFISMLTVIVVPFFDGLSGSIVPARTWFGALISVLGVAMLESDGSPPCVGDLLNFLSAVFFGVHMLRTEHISRSTEKENFLPLLGYEVCVVAVLSALWFLIGGWIDGTQDFDSSSWSWTVLLDWVFVFPWLPALYTGILSTGFCLWVEMDAMRDVSATETAIIYGLEPVWGGAFAWFFLGERWGLIGWIGAALILGGSLTIQIFASSFPSDNKSLEGERTKKVDPNLLDSIDKSSLSVSPVVVRTRKDVPDLFKK